MAPLRDPRRGRKCAVPAAQPEQTAAAFPPQRRPSVQASTLAFNVARIPASRRDQDGTFPQHVLACPCSSVRYTRRHIRVLFAQEGFHSTPRPFRNPLFHRSEVILWNDVRCLFPHHSGGLLHCQYFTHPPIAPAIAGKDLEGMEREFQALFAESARVSRSLVQLQKIDSGNRKMTQDLLPGSAIAAIPLGSIGPSAAPSMVPPALPFAELHQFLGEPGFVRQEPNGVLESRFHFTGRGRGEGGPGSIRGCDVGGHGQWLTCPGHPIMVIPGLSQWEMVTVSGSSESAP